MSKDGMINSTKPVSSGGNTGLGTTLDLYESGWNMNVLNDPIGSKSQK